MFDFRENLIIRVVKGNKINQESKYYDLLDAMRECDSAFSADPSISMIKVFRKVSKSIMLEAYCLER